jgi:hypothetical protein
MNLLLSMFVSLSEPATSTWLDISEWFLLICGLLLLIGIFGEYDKLPKRLFPFSEATFAMLVMLAIAGELVGDGGVFIFSSHLQKLEGADIQTLSQKSEAALRDASTADDDAKSAAAVSNDAKSKSDEAEKSAGSAQILAHEARTEADSFEKDIVTAKQQAATAESHLAEALKQAAYATAELNRLKMPRTLANVDVLVAGLSQFKNTDYKFVMVYPNDESIDLLKSIDDVLQRAGWNRQSQQGLNLGVPALNITDPHGKFVVPEGIDTGVEISADSSEPVDVLNSLPQDKLPAPVRIAAFLRSVLASSILPSNDVNTKVSVNDSKQPTSLIHIAVGQKP